MSGRLDEARIQVLVSKADHRRIRIRAAEVGVPVSTLGRKLFLEWVAGTDPAAEA